MLGPAQNLDGTLKDAGDIEWAHSRSPSPNLPHIRKMATPKGKSTGPKKRSHKKSVKATITHPTKSITSAVTNLKKTQRHNLTLHDKITILDFMTDETKAGRKISQAKVVEHFRTQFPSLTQSSISRIKTEAEELRRRAEDPAQLFYKRPRIVQFPQVEESLSMWVVQCEAKGVKLTGDVIKEKARRFAELYDIPADRFLGLSNGWLDAFKARHLLKEYRFHGEAGSVASTSVAVARERLQKITSRYSKRDTYNMDETGLFYRMPPDRSLATKQMSGVKGDKTRISIALTTNADGSDRRAPLFIGHARRPRCFDKKDGSALGFVYYWNKKAWMTGAIFQRCVTYQINVLTGSDWIVCSFLNDFDADMRRQGRKVLLLLDNAPSHIFNKDSVTNTEVVFLEPLMTSHIQPMDAGVIKAFKAHYRCLYIHCSIDRDEAGFVDIYHIDQLEGQRLTLEAWDQVTGSTIANCWRHAGILPTDDIPIDPALTNTAVDSSIAQLDAALNELAAAAILPRNVISSAKLVAMKEEVVTEEEWTDEDIVEQVRFDEIEAAGGVIEELQEPLPQVEEPQMSLTEACRALTRLDYLFRHRDGNDFIQARKLFTVLRMDLRAERAAALKQQGIESYFTRN